MYGFPSCFNVYMYIAYVIRIFFLTKFSFSFIWIDDINIKKLKIYLLFLFSVIKELLKKFKIIFTNHNAT